MRLMIELALRDLLRQRVHLICNVAILAGVLVPLMVVFGVQVIWRKVRPRTKPSAVSTLLTRVILLRPRMNRTADNR